MENVIKHPNALVSIEMPAGMAFAIYQKCVLGQRLSLPERQQIVRDFEEALHQLFELDR